MWDLARPTLLGGTTRQRIVTYVIAALTAVFLWILAFSPSVFAATDASWKDDSTVSYRNKDFKETTANGTNPPGVPNGTKVYVNTETGFFGGGTANVIVFASSPPQAATAAKFTAYEWGGSGSFGAVKEQQDITVTPRVASQSATNAVWQGDNLSFNSLTLSGDNNKPRIANGNGNPLPNGTQFYVNTGNPNTVGDMVYSVIYFPPGTDVRTATSAQFATYNVSGGGANWSPRDPPRTITVTPAANSPSGTQPGSVASSCQIDGIGWIVCPVSIWIAEGMDMIYKWIASFFEVQPAESTSNSGLFKTWNIMRSFANVVFAIVFLVIIYSQVTSQGISNYGIKRLLPRMVVGVILVNISYYICALAIDLSNIVGYALQDLLMNIRRSVFQLDNGSWSSDIYSWQSVTAAILSGGAIAGAGLVGLFGAASGGGSVVALSFVLIPTLVGLLIAVLVVFVILAARQAIIAILVVISPLALVALILPNTEKWFNKWKDLFITLIIFFPAFALIFGGAQLASAVILQNPSSINEVLLALVIQVAPLVIAPILLKLSGTLVSRIAGLFNNPNRGLLDTTRNWANDRAEHHRKRIRAGHSPLNGLNLSRRLHQGKMRREFKNSLYDAETEQRFEEMKSRKRGLYQTEVNLQISKIHTENAKNDLKRAVEELKAGNSDFGANRTLTVGSAAVARNALAAADQRTRILDSAIRSAGHIQTVNYAKAMEASQELREAAGGIDPNGASHALASAIQTIHRSFDDAVSAEKTTMTSESPANLSGIIRNVSASAERRAAAASQLISVGADSDLHDTLDYLGTTTPTNESEREALSSIQKQFAADVGSRKPVSLGASDIAALKLGEYSGDFDSKVKSRLTTQGGKLSVDSIRTASADELRRILAHKGDVSSELKQQIRDFRDTKKNPEFINQQPSKEIGDLMDNIAS